MLDTSALVPDGLRRDLQEAAQAGYYDGLWSAWVIAELNRVLMYRRTLARLNRGEPLSQAWLESVGRQANAMMSLLLETFELVQPDRSAPSPWPSLGDISDFPIWAAAFTGGARYVVSNDVKHSPRPRKDGRRRFRGIEYVTGQEFLRLISYR